MRIVTGLGLFALLLSGCSDARYEGARGSEDIELDEGITISPELSDDVTVTRRHVRRLADGRLQLQLVIASNLDEDRPVMVQTQFVDETGMVVGESAWRQLLLRSGTTTVYESASLDARPADFTVAIRPVNLERE